MILDGAAIASLYRSHGHVVLRRARTLLGSEADAREALQEIFTALVRNPDAVRSAGSIVGWLYQATTHHCLNLLRKARTGARVLELHVRPGCRRAEVRGGRRPPRCAACWRCCPRTWRRPSSTTTWTG